MITNIGVNEFSVPARELSIPCSAMQNKYAGNNTSPDEMMRKEATWNAVNATRPSFIKIKLLPHIKDRAINISQLINLLFKSYFF